MNVLRNASTMPCTIAIITVWAAVWCVIAVKDISPLLGGKGISKIGNDYYRFFTAGLTHTSLKHLLVNAFAMFWVGYLYEGHMGSARFLTVGLLCAVTAQFLFLCVYGSTESSFGGSVYIFALCGFCLISQFLSPDFPRFKLGTWGGNWLTIYLIASNIPKFLAPDLSTLVIHGIAFALGCVAALGSHLLGWM